MRDALDAQGHGAALGLLAAADGAVARALAAQPSYGQLQQLLRVRLRLRWRRGREGGCTLAGRQEEARQGVRLDVAGGGREARDRA